MSPFARYTFAPVNHASPLTNQIISNTIENFSSNNNPLFMESNAGLISGRATRAVLPEGVNSFAELEMYAMDHQAFLYMTVTILCLLLYDYLLTLDMEIAYIWKARPRITVTNCLFFVNRYYPIFRAMTFTYFSFNPSDNQAACDRWIDLNSYSVMINVATGELLMFVRTWALWNQSRRIGIIMFGFFVGALGAVIAITRPSIPPAPGVVPLPPVSVLFCDRPSPHKYLYVYCVALVVEFTCVSFMFGRIMYITNFSKVPPKLQSQRVHSKPTVAALPLLRTLQRHGAYYFLVVICVILLTVISSFVRHLSRVIVNSGLAPAATSIACNRAIFALRGFYLDPGDNFTRDTEGRETKPREEARFSEEFAETRRDLTTVRDLDLNCLEEDKDVKPMDSRLRQLPVLNHSSPNQPQTYHSQAPTTIPLAGAKTARLKLNFHTHGASSSSVMTSDGSSGHGKSPSSPVPPPVPPKPYREEEMSHQQRTMDSSKIATRYPPPPGNSSTLITPGTSPTSPALGSLKRSLSGIMNAASSSANRSPTATRPTLEDDLMRSGVEPEGLSERLGTIWNKRKVRRPEEATDPSYRHNEDLDRERAMSMPKPKERHPLDHHYEMEPIHSEILNELSSDHDANTSRLTLDTGSGSQHVHENERDVANVENGNAHDPGGDNDRAHAHTPTHSHPYIPTHKHAHAHVHAHAHGRSRQRDLESGVYRSHDSQELSPIVYSNNFRAYSEDL